MPERVCKTCKNQVVWGCDAYDSGELDPYGNKIWLKAAMIPLVFDNEEVWQCPRRPLKDDPEYWAKLLFHYALYKKGHLSDPGAVFDQSFKSLQLFGLIDDTVEECTEERMQREKEKAARQAYQRS